MTASVALAAPEFTDSTDSPVLPQVVVTATRQPTRADELIADVTVIDRAQIERSEGRSVADVLSRFAGVQMSSNGALGSLSSVYLRGMESRHTLLLIDGMRYGSASAGVPVFDNLPLAEIERIEIVRGPASGLYGSDAVGGVIQIFTRSGSGRRTARGAKCGDGGDAAGSDSGIAALGCARANAAVTVGSLGFRSASAGLGGNAGLDDAIDWSGGVQHTRRRGESATNPAVPFGNYNPDRDGFSQTSFNAGVGVRINADWRARASALESRGVVDLDDGVNDAAPNSPAKSFVRSQVLSASIDGAVLPGWSTTLRVGSSTDVADTYASAFEFNLGAFRTRQDQAAFENRIDTPIGTLLAAVEHLHQSVHKSTTPDFDTTSRNVDALIAGLDGSADGHVWQLSARHDRNSQYGSQNNGTAGYGYEFLPHWRAGVSVGTSFVAPSVNQLYWPQYGNPNLLPEESRHRELSLHYTGAEHDLRVAWFGNRVRNFITSGLNATNVPHAVVTGWTGAYIAHIDELDLGATLDLIDPRNEVTGAPLPRRAKRVLGLTADRRLGDWQVGAGFRAVGERVDIGENGTEKLDGYALVDLHASRKLTRDLTLDGHVDNLADKRYATAIGYNPPGRAVFMTLRYAMR